jgi:hypothetical protein
MGLFSLALCCLFIPAIAVGVFLDTRWVFFEQAIVLENYNSTGGLGRSWKLVKGTFWRVLGLVFVIALLVSLFSTGPILLIAMFSTLLLSPVLTLVLNSVTSSIIIIIMTPLQFAALTILYYDLRIRKEGFDLQMQMQELPEAPIHPQVPAQAQTPSPVETQTSQDPPLDLPSLYSRDEYPPK